MKNEKIAFIDPGTFVPVHDRFFINSIVKYVDVDFYYSLTKYNLTALDRLDKKVHRYPYSISSSTTTKLNGVLNYVILLAVLFWRRKKYQYIHFNWSIMPRIDRFLLPILFQKKLIYSLHNLIPHGHDIAKPVAEHDLARRSQKLVILSGHVTIEARLLNPKTYLMQHGLTISPSRPVARDITKCYFVGNVKPYKGVSSFIDLAERAGKKFQFHIYGKWDTILWDEKVRATKFCKVENEFLPESEFNSLFSQGDSILILPYSDITQSGIMYNVIAGCAPFIASDRGEFSVLARKIGYPKLLFDPSDISQMEKALSFCLRNAQTIKYALAEIQKDYTWSYGRPLVTELYGE